MICAHIQVFCWRRLVCYLLSVVIGLRSQKLKWTCVPWNCLYNPWSSRWRCVRPCWKFDTAFRLVSCCVIHRIIVMASLWVFVCFFWVLWIYKFTVVIDVHIFVTAMYGPIMWMKMTYVYTYVCISETVRCVNTGSCSVTFRRSSKSTCTV